MAHPRTPNSNALFVFLAVVAFLISGIVTASPKPFAQQGHLIPPLSTQLFRVQVLSALPEGVDFEPYWRNLDASIGRNLLASVPKSAAKGEKGVVGVRVQIQNVGTLADKTERIVSITGKNDMDAGARIEIRPAAQFGRLPDADVRAKPDFRVTLCYD